MPQSGSLSSSRVVFVMFVALPPPLPITQMSSSRSNAILVPSGDQVGCSASAPVVSWIAPEPSAFMIQICLARVNAIFVPSGDHDGSWSLLLPPVPVVMFAAPDPSAFMTPMSESPALSS
jgi:hypothetical protein